MKLLCILVGIFTALTSFAQKTISTGGSTGNTTSGGGGSVRSVNGGSTTGVRRISPAVTAGGTITGVGGTTIGAVPIVENATDLFGRINGVGGTTGNAINAVPIVENTTDLFGRINGTTVRSVVPGNDLLGNPNPTPNPLGGLTGSSAVRSVVAQQSAQGIGAPGFTTVTITLQGTVQNEVDRQSILNRFQGLSGFVVVDQLQIAGQTTVNAVVNEAAGTGTATETSTDNGLSTGTATGLTKP